MRANVDPDPTVTVVGRRLPRPVVWLLWLLGALLGSVLLGFLAGLARPREPDSWAGASPPESPPAAATLQTTSSNSSPAPAEDE